MLSLREQIIAVNHKKREPIVVPEWPTPEHPEGVTVYAVTISSKQQTAWLKACEKNPDTSSNAIYLVFGLEDEAGNPVFTLEDVPTITGFSAAIVSRLARKIEALQPTITEAKKN